MWGFLPYLYKDVPKEFFIVLLSILIAGILCILCFKGIKQGLRISVGFTLIVYAIFIVSITLVFRIYDGSRSYNLCPFWSYKEIISVGNNALFYQNICNILVFIPFGFLCGIYFRDLKWSGIVLIAFLFSVLIEMSQLLLRRGFSEIDDVFHNVLGSVIGYGFLCLLRYVYKKTKKMLA